MNLEFLNKKDFYEMHANYANKSIEEIWNNLKLLFLYEKRGVQNSEDLAIMTIKALLEWAVLKNWKK